MSEVDTDCVDCVDTKGYPVLEDTKKIERVGKAIGQRDSFNNLLYTQDTSYDDRLLSTPLKRRKFDFDELTKSIDVEIIELRPRISSTGKLIPEAFLLRAQQTIGELEREIERILKRRVPTSGTGTGVDLSSQMDAVNKQQAALNAQLATLGSQLAAASSENASLKAKVASLEAIIASLRAAQQPAPAPTTSPPSQITTTTTIDIRPVDTTTTVAPGPTTHPPQTTRAPLTTTTTTRAPISGGGGGGGGGDGPIDGDYPGDGEDTDSIDDRHARIT